jgi:curved DNA-binding protein CbpA
VSDADPFAVLGLSARPDLSDDDIRAAWRRIAAAVHPDRADGGDPARFAEAAAAYTVLRTVTGRREAHADLAAARRGGPGRIRRGRPAVLALRLAVAAGISAGALAVAGPEPASLALIAGALTWLARTGYRELAPPARPGCSAWSDRPRKGSARHRRRGREDASRTRFPR